MQRGLTLTGEAALPVLAHQPTTDEALVRNIAQGDKRAMQVLFARHNVRVYRFVMRILGDSGPAEDLVSEVFLEVWRKAHQFEGRSQASTWLLGIARHKALTHLRRRTIDQLDEEAAHAVEDPADSPHAVLEQKDVGMLLRQALTQLSPAHREIIDLIYYHERSMQDVSEILQIPEGTVRTRMFYARKHLAEILNASGLERNSV
jgi:RNA polymerase sigma-70 factor (ECF subfamily)